VGLLAAAKANSTLRTYEIEHAGATALRIRGRRYDFEQVSAAVDRMRRDYGGVQVLICALGVPGPSECWPSSRLKALAETIQ